MDQSSINLVTSRGKVIEIQERNFEKTGGENVKYFVLVLMHTFVDYHSNRTEEKLHVTHVSKPSLFDAVGDLRIGDDVEVTSRVESFRNSKDPHLFFHKCKAIRIEVLSQGA